MDSIGTLPVMDSRSRPDADSASIRLQPVDWALVALICLVLFVLTRNLEANDLIGGDEGYYAVMARNACQGFRAALNPSLTPLGDPGDKPPLVPLFLSLGLLLGGIREGSLRLPILLTAVAIAPLLILVTRAVRANTSGKWAAAIWLCTPAIAYAGRIVQAEPVLVALGLAGMWGMLRAIQRDSSGVAIVGGALLGLAYLSKLWLVAPLIAAIAGAACLEIARPHHERVSFLRVLLVGAAAFLIVASAQILLCFLVTPETVPHWIRIYFEFSMQGRGSGQGYADYWIKPWHYYLRILGQSMTLWLPLVVLGIFSWIQEARSGSRRAWTCLSLVGGWLVVLIPFSAMAVKSGNYTLPFLPALCLCAGQGIVGFRSRHCPVSVTSLLLASLMGALLVLAAQIESAGGLRLHSSATTSIGLCWSAVIAATAIGGRHRSLRAASTVLLAVTLLAGLARQVQLTRVQNHSTGFASLARALEPGLLALDAREPCFFAPEWPSMSFYTYRTGRYWESPYVPPDPDSVLRSLESEAPWFYVVATPGLYGGHPDSIAMSAILSSATLWSEFDGVPSRISVYVNRALAERLDQERFR